MGISYLRTLAYSATFDSDTYTVTAVTPNGKILAKLREMPLDFLWKLNYNFSRTLSGFSRRISKKESMQ